MNLDEFKALHKKFENIDYFKQGWMTDEYDLYIEAIHEKQEFHNWVLIKDLEKEKFDYLKFCCVSMAHKVYVSIDNKGEIKQGNNDAVINRWKDGTYGIPIHDGGMSVVKINFCPWCGENLKNNE
ncbi:MAG: hypothetical protein COA67_11510 [Lutibacter sp.]|nr:MAG: hypothetical protein COA67_11510 [Lutibacter sp.]